MNLVIMSQDREILSRSDQIYVGKSDEYGKEDLYEVKSGYMPHFVLGTYQTKERAMEVLMDISKHINEDKTYYMPTK